MSEVPTKLLIQVDKILCGCWHGEDLLSYGIGWLEIGLEPGEAEILQEFHDAVKEAVA